MTQKICQRFSLKADDVEMFQDLQDDACSVCGDATAEEDNDIVFCDGCDIAVHQLCYGIEEIPEGRWLCKKCSSGDQKVVILALFFFPFFID